jgi:hypothetical protein
VNITKRTTLHKLKLTVLLASAFLFVSMTLLPAIPVHADPKCLGKVSGEGTASGIGGIGNHGNITVEVCVDATSPTSAKITSIFVDGTNAGLTGGQRDIDIYVKNAGKEVCHQTGNLSANAAQRTYTKDGDHCVGTVIDPSKDSWVEVYQNGGTQGQVKKYSITNDVINGKASADGNPSGDNSGNDRATCEASGISLSWIICPLLNGLGAAADGIFNSFVVPFLQTSVINLDNGNDPIIKAWSNFRNIANVVLVIALLAAVFGQAIGGGLIDAYTIKKMLPRLLVAGILVNVSIYIVAGLLDVFNILGHAIGDLIVTPFQTGHHLEYKLNFGSQAGGFIALMALVFALKFIDGFAMMLFLFVLLPALLAMLGVFITLIVRQALILFLVLVSPIAFVLYALPNTEQYFRKWWSLLAKTLMVYPLIVALFALSQVMAVLLTQANSTSGPREAIAGIAAMLVSLIPLFLIPYAFKLAGGAIGGLHELVANYRKRAHEGILGNPNLEHSLRNRTRSKVGQSFVDRRFAANTRLVPLASRLESRGGRVSSRLGRGLGRVGGAIGGGANINAHAAAQQEAATKHAMMVAENGDEAYLQAATIPMSMLDEWKRTGHRYQRSEDGRDTWQTADGRYVDIATIRQGHQEYSTEPMRTAAFKVVAQKAENGSEDNQNRIFEDYLGYANEANLNPEVATGHWQGIAIPYKGIRVDLRRRQISKGADGRLTGTRADGELDVNHAAMVKEYANFDTYGQTKQTVGGFHALAGSIDQAYSNAAVHGGNAEVRQNAYLAAKNLQKFVGESSEEGGSRGFSGSQSAAYKNSAAAQEALRNVQHVIDQHEGRTPGGGTP